MEQSRRWSWPHLKLGPPLSPFPAHLNPRVQTRLTMQPTRALLAEQKKNLLICLDAFGTLFTPKEPISVTYARAALRHGLPIDGAKDADRVMHCFRSAFKGETHRNPNYGRSTGMGAERWWSNVSVCEQLKHIPSGSRARMTRQRMAIAAISTSDQSDHRH
jgi:hypothetical protein